MKSSQAVSCFKMECISVLETISASIITSLKMGIVTASKTLEIHSVLTQMTVQEESLCKNSSKHWPMIKNWCRRKHTPILFIKFKMKMPPNVTHCWCNLANASKYPIMEMLQLSMKITGIFNVQKKCTLDNSETGLNVILFIHIPTQGLPTTNLYYSPVNGVSLCLGRIFNIRLIQKILNSKKDLLNSNCWAPIFLLIQQWQAHGTCNHYRS